MASYNELIALINAFIKQNGIQAITGQILNGVLRAMVDQIGRGYAIMGTAVPTDDPGTPDAPESWFASTPGTYTNFGGFEVADAEFALLSYTPSTGWAKNTLTTGITEVDATVDNTTGTPSVSASYANGVLSFEFHNLKGATGDPAGFGTVNATVDANVGTPSVSVSGSGPDTAKNYTFAFHNLKGETGVTSVVATVDNTTGNPACAVSLVGQELHLDFTGLKGAQGNTGSSVDYPFTIVNNLTTNDATKALSAAMGVELAGQVSQLEAEVDGLARFVSGKFVYSNGALGTNADYNASDYVDVSAFTKIKFVVASAPSDGQVRIVEFDENKAYVDNWGYTYNGTKFTRNANTKYVRLSYLKTETDPKIYGDDDVVWTPYIVGHEQRIEDLENKSVALENQIGDVEQDLEDLEQTVDGTINYTEGYCLMSNGTTQANADYAYSTDYIDVSAYAKLKFSVTNAPSNGQVRLIEYNSSKAYVDNWGYNYNNSQFNRGTNTKYVRLSFLKAETDGAVKIYGDGVVIWEKGLAGGFEGRISSLETSRTTDEAQIANNTQRIEALEAGTTLPALPDYYSTGNYIQGKAEDIDEYAQEISANGDIFLFITDFHWWTGWNQMKSPSIIQYLFKNSFVDKVLCGGDVVLNQYYESGTTTLNTESVSFSKDCIEKCRKATGGRIWYAMGNHEWQGNTDTNFLSYMYEKGRDDIKGDDAGKYFYFDNERTKTRYIFLNTFGPHGFYSNDAGQLAWFTGVALLVDAGWHIIIVTHSVLSMNYATDECKIYNNVGTQAIISAIDDYSGDGEIVCILQGEHHRDRIVFTPGGIPIIMTAGDTNLAGDPQNPDINVDRTSGTIHEQCMDIMCIDYANKVIHAVRVGGLARDGVGNLPGNEVEERTINY